MIPSFLSFFGLIHIDRHSRVLQYKSHSSYAGNVFNIERLLQNFPLFSSVYESNLFKLIAEYIATCLQTTIFGILLYFSLTIPSYLFFFKYKKTRFLPQLNGKYLIYHDIKWSVINILVESFLVSALRMTLPRFSFIYYDVEDYGIAYIFASIFLHILFDETFTYWIHRILHTNDYLYRKLHVIHHRSVDITPFAGFAFHPFDAFAQAVPTFVSCYFFPIHYNVVLVFSIMTTMWAISIHDNVPVIPIKLFLYSTHHTIHHERGYGRERNYGKFTSVWDRLMGTYDDPDRIYFGYERDEQTKGFFKRINQAIEWAVPDRTVKKVSVAAKKKN